MVGGKKVITVKVYAVAARVDDEGTSIHYIQVIDEGQQSCQLFIFIRNYQN